jgi:hypothetical protein
MTGKSTTNKVLLTGKAINYFDFNVGSNLPAKMDIIIRLDKNVKK